MTEAIPGPLNHTPVEMVAVKLNIPACCMTEQGLRSRLTRLSEFFAGDEVLAVAALNLTG
jgi:hypothetical protein